MYSLSLSIYLSITHTHIYVCACVCGCVLECVITQPLRTNRMWYKVNFSAKFNRFKFSVFFLIEIWLQMPKLKSSSLSYYLLIVGEKIIGFIPLRRVLVQCEGETPLSKFWTWATWPISHYKKRWMLSVSIPHFVLVRHLIYSWMP